MKNMKEKNGSFITTASPITETEIALSQKLQREETLLRNLLDSTCRFHEFNKSSTASKDRMSTLIQNNIEHEERKSIAILRQELVDCRALQEQQMQVMEHLDAENKALQTRIGDILEWRRKISGQASLVRKTINRIFQVTAEAPSSTLGESPEMKGCESEWSSPLVPVDVRDRSFLLRIATVLEQYEQVIDPEVTKGSENTSHGDLFSAAAFTEAFFCHNCMVKYSDDGASVSGRSHISYDITKLVDAFNETSFLVTQSSAEDVLYRLFDIFATRQREELLSGIAKTNTTAASTTATQTSSPSAFTDFDGVPYIGEVWFMLLCISCELLDEKVSFDVAEAIYLQLSGDNSSRIGKGYVGLDYNSFFIAMYVMACMKYDEPDDQQRIFLMIESVQPSLVQMLEKPRLLDKIVSTFHNFVSQKVFYKFVQYQKIIFSAFRSCIKKFNSSKKADSVSTAMSPSPRRRSASFSALGGSGSGGICGYNSPSSSHSEIRNPFEFFCQKFKITPDLVSLLLVRRVASHIQTLFVKATSYVSFFGCLHILVVSLIDNAVLQTPSKQIETETANAAHKVTITNYSSLVQVGIERIVWQVQSILTPNSRDLVRLKPFSPKIEKKSRYVSSHEVPLFDTGSHNDSNHSITDRSSHPILSLTDIDIIGHTSGGQLLLAENESFRQELDNVKSEYSMSIQELERTIAWQNEQLELSRQEFELQRRFLSQQSDSSTAVISALRRQLDHPTVDVSNNSGEKIARLTREYESKVDELNSMLEKYKTFQSEESKSFAERVQSLEEELRLAIQSLDNEKVSNKEMVEVLARDYEMKSVELGVRNIDYLTKIDTLTAQVYECHERLHMREEEISSIMRTQQLLNSIDSLQAAQDTNNPAMEDSYDSRLARASMLISALQLQLDAATTTISSFCSESDRFSQLSERNQREIELRSMACEDLYNHLVISHITNQHLELKIDAVKAEMTSKVLNLSAVHTERLVALTQWNKYAINLEREKSAAELLYVNELSDVGHKHALEIAVHEEQARILQNDMDEMKSVIADQNNQLVNLSSKLSAYQESESESESRILQLQTIITENEANVKTKAEIISQMERDLSDLQLTLQKSTAAYEEKVIELTGKLEAETRKVGERDRTPQEEEHAIGTKKLVKKVVEDNDRQAHDVISIDKFVAAGTSCEQTVSGSANFNISFDVNDDWNALTKENAVLKDELLEEKEKSKELIVQLRKQQEELNSAQAELKKKILKERNASVVRSKTQQELQERDARIRQLEKELGQLRGSLSVVPSEEAQRYALEMEEINESLRAQLRDSKQSFVQKVESLGAEMNESKAKHENEIRDLRGKLSAAIEKIQGLQQAAVSEAETVRYNSSASNISSLQPVVAIAQLSVDIVNSPQLLQSPPPPTGAQPSKDVPPPTSAPPSHSEIPSQRLINNNPPHPPPPPARRQSMNDAPPPPPKPQAQSADPSKLPPQPPLPPNRRQSMSDVPPPPPKPRSESINPLQNHPLQPPLPPARRQSMNDVPPPPPRSQSQPVDATTTVISVNPPKPRTKSQSRTSSSPPPPPEKNPSLSPAEQRHLSSKEQVNTNSNQDFPLEHQQLLPTSTVETTIGASDTSQPVTALGVLLFQDWARGDAFAPTVERSIHTPQDRPVPPASRNHSISDVQRPPLPAPSISSSIHPPPLIKRECPAPPPPQPPSRRQSATAASIPTSDSKIPVVAPSSIVSVEIYSKDFAMDFLPPSEVHETQARAVSLSLVKPPSRRASMGSVPPPPPTAPQIVHSNLSGSRRASMSGFLIPQAVAAPPALSTFNRKNIFIDLPNNSKELGYSQWVEEVRNKLKNWRDHEDFCGQTDYEFSQKLRRHYKFTECDTIVRYILSHSTAALLTAMGDSAINAFLAMLIEHFDLSRTGRISAKEFIDFLFPPPGVRELGLLVKIVREGVTQELNKGRSKLSARRGSYTDLELFDAMIRLAKKKNVFASPYIGKNLETKTFRAILESLHILDRKEEVDLVIQAIDLNVDRRLSIQEIKNWLFPAPAEDFIGKFRLSSTENDSAIYFPPIAATMDSMGHGDVQDGGSVLSLFRSALLAHCDNDRQLMAEMFLKFDSDGDGSLSTYEVTEMIEYLLMTLREKFIEEDLEESIALSEQGCSDVSVGNSPVQKEELRFQLMQRHRREVEEEVAGINALLFEHVDGDKNGTIELDELLRFIWPSPAEGDVETVLEFRPFDMAEQAVREKILLKMDLPTNVSNAIISAADSTLGVKFRAFLESSPANKDFKCTVSVGVFVSLALERALICLPMPEFGGSQHLTAVEVSLILGKMDVDHDGVITVNELRTWLIG